MEIRVYLKRYDNDGIHVLEEVNTTREDEALTAWKAYRQREAEFAKQPVAVVASIGKEVLVYHRFDHKKGSADWFSEDEGHDRIEKGVERLLKSGE
ncbi:hypothetical protein [Magnetofaba australis]|nr:hypothetical protein [Magnetofaba australis]